MTSLSGTQSQKVRKIIFQTESDNSFRASIPAHNVRERKIKQLDVRETNKIAQ